jgi:hypothetical protein
MTDLIPESFELKALIFVAAVVPLAVVVFGQLRGDAVAERWRRALVGLALAVVGLYGLMQLAVVGMNLLEPPEWDFKYFWTFGTAAATGSNPYDRENLLRIAEPLKPAQELHDELYCFYPPPSLLMFLPLGWFEFRTAMALWYAVQLGVLAVDVWLLTRLLTERARFDDLALVAAAVLIFRPVTTTVTLAQTNFLILLMLLLFWGDRERARGGVWLGLAMIVKPWVAVVGLYLLVRKKWSTIATFAATLMLILAATAAIFGPKIFSQHLYGDKLLAVYPYAQTMNQSLVGVLMRHGPELAAGQSPLLSPWYLGIAAAMTGWTVFCLFRFRQAADDWALAMVIVLGMIIYPPTLAHYSVALLIPVMLWWRDLAARRGQVALAGTLVLTTFLLVALKLSFAAMLLAWCALSILGLLYIAPRNDERASLLRSAQPGHAAAGRGER